MRPSIFLEPISEPLSFLKAVAEFKIGEKASFLGVFELSSDLLIITANQMFIPVDDDELE